MKKFIVIYHAPADAQMEMSDMTPEEQAKGMEPWMVWAKKCGDKLIDLGSPLANGQVLTSKGSSASTGNVAGYSVIQAENMNDAKALLKDHPHLANASCTIEVHETLALPGM